MLSGASGAGVFISLILTGKSTHMVIYTITMYFPMEAG